MIFKKKGILALIALFAFVLALALPSLARAGGWAVVTLDKWPEKVVAGQPYPLGLMGRQHGRTPMEVEKLTIEARLLDDGDTVTFTALPDQTPGHFTTELLFPKSGTWRWSIITGFFPEQQPLPALVVIDAVAAAGATVPAVPSQALTFPQILLGALTLAVFTAGLVMILRSRGARTRILYGALMALVCGSLIFALFTSVNAQARQSTSIPAVPATVDTGRQLFLAKGCVVCHINDRVIENSKVYSVDVGPNLTSYSNDPDFLRKWLANPTGVRSSATMPVLGLSDSEIEALIKFINAAE